MTRLERLLAGAVAVFVCVSAYQAFVLGRQRVRLRELDSRLAHAIGEREDLTRALAASQKEVRDMDATLAKVQRVLEGMKPVGAAAGAQAAATVQPPPLPVPPPMIAVPQPPVAIMPSASPAPAPVTPAAAKPDAERIEAARAEARQLSIALLQAAVDYAEANAGQKPTDPTQLLQYLPPEMADKLRQLLPEPRKD